ncbi:MAG: ribosome biogenesis GTPase YlqF [Firmicutes bacterium]|nr:ribosome biogenesis GTPase YlqF [Bacillota bacterium]
MSIQWFPGHMAKARREVTDSLRLVDTVIEIVDARLPESSRNPMMLEITKHKPTVLVLAKADLADPKVTANYLKHFKNEHVLPVAVDNLRGEGLNLLTKAAHEVTREQFAKMQKKGIRRKAIRAIVVGIPNVGKSSLINRVTGRSVAKTGDKPGVTKQQQWIKVEGSFELLDTPGILWPKFDDPDVARRLAWSGAIKSELLPTEELALAFVDWLKVTYPQSLTARFDCSTDGADAVAILEDIARRRGALRPGGIPDREMAADILLRDFQKGLMGRITLDRPPTAD